ncbi:MAG: hypothetical protein WDO71_17445 [Bacteroidota bacterium]
MDEITSTNPVAVGDEVEIEVENEGESTATITKIIDRRNYINRQSPRFAYQHHIVASNLDQSMLVATLKEPRTSQGFIDRFPRSIGNASCTCSCRIQQSRPV